MKQYDQLMGVDMATAKSALLSVLQVERLANRCRMDSMENQAMFFGLMNHLVDKQMKHEMDVFDINKIYPVTFMQMSMSPKECTNCSEDH